MLVATNTVQMRRADLRFNWGPILSLALRWAALATWPSTASLAAFSADPRRCSEDRASPVPRGRHAAIRASDRHENHRITTWPKLIGILLLDLLEARCAW